MKNLKKIIFISIIGMIIGGEAFAQPVGAPPIGGIGPRANSAWYRGGNFAPLAPAGLNNIFGFTSTVNLQIWYQTNGFNRMVMMNGLAGPTNGRIGMGENLPGGFIPQSRLHLNVNTANPVDLRFTNLTTGIGAGNGLQIGESGTGEAGFKQWFDNDMSFATYAIRHLMIARSTATRPGGVSIGDALTPLFNPQSMLHIHASTAAPTDLRFTNLTSGTAFTDGFRIGMTPNALTSRLAMLEPAGDMRFATGLADRMIILPNGFVGVNILAPTDRVEINSGLNCVSGLTFTQLTSALCTPVPNPGTGVLSVDPLGRVIYVNGGASAITGANNGLSVTGSNVQLGGLCGSAGAAMLLNNREVPMNNFNLYFSDANTNTGSLYIGSNTPSCPVIQSRLDIINNSKTAAGFFSTVLASAPGIAGFLGQSQNTGTGPSVGVSGRGQSTGGSAIGVSAVSLGGSTTATTFSIGCNAASLNPGGTSTQVIAVNAQSKNGLTYSISGNFDVVASTSPQNFGIQSEVMNNTTVGTNYGGQWLVSNNAPGSTNYGGQFIVSNNTTGSINYGIYSRCLPAPNSGLGPNWAGFFDGDVFTTSVAYYGSDRNLKRDINTIQNSLDIVNKLNPVSYFFDTENKKDVGLSYKKQYGFISQEVKEILPELTSTGVIQPLYDSLGKETSPKQEYLGINYNGFIAILTEAIKEQQKEIEELKGLIGSNANQQNNSGSGNINQSNVTLSDKDIVVLDQNVPNPFAEQTIISYNLPESIGRAQMLFYNVEGKLINSIDLTQKGKGQLTVFASDLSTGIYSYTLVVDGKVFDTKKMMKSK